MVAVSLKKKKKKKKKKKNIIFFFFKQKTAYEMCDSDWSSDVCSSDLGGPEPDFADLGVAVRDLLADATLFATADGFVLFSSAGWSWAHQARLAEALARRPRPVLVANPDIVAPREDRFSLEPGHFGHLLQDEVGAAPAYYGKPYANAYDAARDRLGREIPPGRIAMVGDTLHTDVLGGRAAGMATILVTDHGLFRGRDPAPYIARSGIVPDVVARTF